METIHLNIYIKSSCKLRCLPKDQKTVSANSTWTKLSGVISDLKNYLIMKIDLPICLHIFISCNLGVYLYGFDLLIFTPIGIRSEYLSSKVKTVSAKNAPSLYYRHTAKLHAQDKQKNCCENICL